MTFDINVTSSGSDGNHVIIDECIVIDLGLPKKLTDTDAIRNASAILITHRHGDHLKMPPLTELRKKSPLRIQHNLYAPRDVFDKIQTEIDKMGSRNLKFWQGFMPNVENILDDNSVLTISVENKGDYKIETFKCQHDVECLGYIITNPIGEQLIYATDTETMMYAPNRKYDYIMVEGNYDEDGLIADMQSGDMERIDRATRNLRHLSIQDFEDFVRHHSKPNSVVYQMHMSGEYGLRSDIVTDEY